MGHGKRICSILKSEWSRQARLYRIHLEAQLHSSLGAERARRVLWHFRHLANRTTESLWQCTLSQLRAHHRPKVRTIQGNRIYTEGDVTLPEDVSKGLALGPKFAVQPRNTGPELLSLVHKVSGLAPASEMDRCGVTHQWATGYIAQVRRDPQFGEDPQKIHDRQGKSSFSLGMHVMDATEGIHSCKYIQADVKPSSLLLGFREDNENRMYLADYTWACRHARDSKHKEYKEDIETAHDSTIKFKTGASTLVHARKGVIWKSWCTFCSSAVCCRLLWEDSLRYPEFVSQQKTTQIENIPLLVSKCFPHGDIPCGITVFLQYVDPPKI
ncbi:hypothetical protein HPB52_011372 [Rhipicephalus sanguineus]|uniref:Uncharacterized protein n=1 Tax=Rhipicephalus sanguineus TaxID=34632 RepID=A0A9D4YNE5_RHISA|nr:hypothetical protein HPB52_011372 [Rhipicephalus sanguineus]